ARPQPGFRQPLLKRAAGLRVLPSSNEKEMMALSHRSGPITLEHWPVILPYRSKCLTKLRANRRRLVRSFAPLSLVRVARDPTEVCYRIQRHDARGNISGVEDQFDLVYNMQHADQPPMVRLRASCRSAVPDH